MNEEVQSIQYVNFYQNQASLGVCYGSLGYGLDIQYCIFYGTDGNDAAMTSEEDVNRKHQFYYCVFDRGFPDT
jgi:hypothetical protein